MTNKFTGIYFTLFLSVFLTIWLSGNCQTGSLSPYSRYGIGDILQEGFTSQTAMGGIGAGLSSPNYINFVNPASYLADTTTMFEFGAKGEVRKLAINDQSTSLNSASFSHFCLAFPVIKNKISASFGLLPYSSVGYNIQVDQENVQNIGTVRSKYEGIGGFNKFFIGAGAKVTRNFSAGINAAYLFGTIENVKSVEFPYNTNYYNSRYINGITANGFYFNYGLLYENEVSGNLQFKAGLTGSLSTKIKATNNQYYYNYTISSFGGEIVKDSIYNEKTNSGSIKLPVFWRLGVSLANSSEWVAGLDFSYQNWEKFENFDSKDSLNNSYTINIGGERKFKKLAYRLGGRYSKTYLNLRDTQLDDYAVTFGIGIQKSNPKRPPSSINIAVELGQRGTLENNLLQEQYIRFHLGFTLTDAWFNRQKYD